MAKKKKKNKNKNNAWKLMADLMFGYLSRKFFIDYVSGSEKG